MESAAGFPLVLTAARGGDEAAWRELYSGLAPIVLRYLKARRAPDPEDLLGDVFVQVVRKLDSFTGGEEEFRAWVITIARHRLIDRSRERGRRPVDPQPDDLIAQVGPSGDVEGDVMRNLDAERLRSAIFDLSPDQQDVIVMRLLLGFNIDEVASALGKNPGAIKALQSRGVRALRRSLGPQAVSYLALAALIGMR